MIHIQKSERHVRHSDRERFIAPAEFSCPEDLAHVYKNRPLHDEVAFFLTHKGHSPIVRRFKARHTNRNMEIKGSAVKSIGEYVEKRHAHKLNEWIESLPEESKKIFTNPIDSTNWYPIDSAAIIPTQKIGTLIFDSTEEGAWELGRYSAETALHGIYKVFVRVLSPAHLIQRASRIFTTFYRPSEIEVIEPSGRSVTLHITEFGAPHVIIEKRIGGWIEKALEITRCKDIKIDIPKSMAKGDPVTEYRISWS
jgi:hypothetical protein